MVRLVIPMSYLYIYFDAFLAASCAFNTRTTIFCSSMRKALTILCLTHLWHLDPPYALVTVFNLLVIDCSSRGLAGVIPCNFTLQSPHTGIDPNFFVYRYTNLPPGVFDTLLRLLLVL